MEQYILALDQGTTSSRAMLFDKHGQVVACAQEEFPQILPAPGIVEHDAEAIWDTQLGVARKALAQAGVAASAVAAIGIANQRETTLLWDRHTGRPVAPAVVWQSRVSAPWCDRLKAQGLEPLFRQRTGLVLDPYFSATKIQYLLETLDLRPAAARGEILFGTVDSFLVWRLTGGRLHLTDPSNASRTLLWNLHTRDWDDELLRLLDIPRAILPEVRPTSQVYGLTDPQWFGHPVPIAAMAGDQQAATFGQACFEPGTAKNTYGTGCFLLMNTGAQPVLSQHNLLATVGWALGDRITYCLEGSVFIAGAVVQWLRDGLGILQRSADVELLARTVPDSGGLYFVPALVGLGAPYWDPYARGTILGITRGTTAAHLARAALEAIAFQTRDLVEAMQQDAGCTLPYLKVDGGAAANDLLMQFQADVLGVEVRRPTVAETTALGAAYLAGLAVGYWPDTDEIARHWALDRCYQPQMPPDKRQRRYQRWQEAVARARHWEEAPTAGPHRSSQARR